jgi:pimeloyl-ACP methyl ester carboxylesterase
MSKLANDSTVDSPAKRGLARRALIAVVLIAIGLLIALPRPYHEHTFLVDAGGCRLETTAFEPAGDLAENSILPSLTPPTPPTPNSPSYGTVVLFHGLAVNRKIMNFLAEGFALQGLRVFVPDLPGHGRTEGPFSPARAEECSENLLHELRSRGLAPPERTILAGHSMGGTIAIRVASRMPVAGVIAFSPAPMRAAHGAIRSSLLFDDPPSLPPNTEIINGSLEPAVMAANARDLLQPNFDLNSHYEVVRGATHGGLIFSSAALSLAQAWAARVLRLDRFDQPAGSSTGAGLSANGAVAHQKLPGRLQFFGALIGLAGLLLISGPFLREAAGISGLDKEITLEDSASTVPRWRAALEIIVVGMLVVELLQHWTPLPLIRLFEGDYLAGYLLCSALVLIALHWKMFMAIFDFRTTSALGAIFGGLTLVFLFTAWFELSLTEAWLNGARWQRFALLFISLIPSLIAEEILLGPLAPASVAHRAWKRVSLAMFYRLLIWLPLMFGILVLHSGEILMFLLVPLFFAFSIPQRRGMDVVREVTSSAAAAALFGAILLAGFFLVIFPLI